MFARWNLIEKRFRFSVPDFSQQRGRNHLLLWSDPPRWSVVDTDFYELLGELDGRRTLHDVIATQPHWLAAKNDVLRGMKRLLKQGTVEEVQKPTKPVALAGSSPPIENVVVNITHRCNLHCAFCYNLGKPANPCHNDLSSSEITSCLKSMRPFMARRPTLMLLGGEPLLAEQAVLTVARAASALGMQVLVSTNGTLITEEFARTARKIGLHVQVSLDGDGAESHDAIRGAGAFEKTLRGIKVLVRYKAHTILSMVCHDGNLECLEGYYRLAQELKVAEARFIPLKRIGGGVKGTCRPVELTRLIQHAFVVFQKHPEYVQLTGRDCFSIVSQVCRLAVKRVSCGTGRQTLLLDADGTIYPCLNTDLPEFRVASIRAPGFDFARTWRESPILGQVRQHSCIDQMNGDCAQCLVKYWCLGGCRGETYRLLGDFRARPTDCSDLRTAIVEMIWLIAEQLNRNDWGSSIERR